MSEYQQHRDRPSRLPALLGGVVLGFFLGAAVVAGSTYAAGYRLVDRDTAKTVEALRAWAKDPETDRKMREAIKNLDKSTKAIEDVGKRLKQEKPPVIIPPPPDDDR